MKDAVQLASASFFFTLAVLLTLSWADIADAGDFSKTCFSIRLSDTMLIADCETGASTQVGKSLRKKTRLELNERIGVTNGALVWNKNNFKGSCINISLENSTTLKAMCLKNHFYQFSTLNLDKKISNKKGTLSFD